MTHYIHTNVFTNTDTPPPPAAPTLLIGYWPDCDDAIF